MARDLSKYKAQVRFKFLGSHYGEDGFYLWLARHLEAAVGGWDTRNAREAQYLGFGHGFAAVAEEGGLGTIWLNGQYIIKCKMFYFDGSEKSANYYNKYKPWFGLVFRDHDTPVSNVPKVWAIADAFETYLKKNRIRYKRFNYLK